MSEKSPKIPETEAPENQPDAEQKDSGKKLIDSIEGFIQNEASADAKHMPDKIDLEDGTYYRMLLLSRGKTFFEMEAYHEAIEAFEGAEQLGSYQGKFLLGLTMTEAPGYDYFAGIDHMIQSVIHMMTGEYFSIFKHALETGKRLSLIPSSEEANTKGPSDLREIAITLYMLKDMESDDPQKNLLLGKLLNLLQRYRMN